MWLLRHQRSVSSLKVAQKKMSARRQLTFLLVVVAAGTDALTTPRHPKVALPRSALLAASVAPVPGAEPENARGLAVAWGVCGFLSILASALGRLTPIALQPFTQNDLSLLQWGL